MKLGFVSSILDGWSFEEMIDTAAAQGFECVEIACWPSAGKTERRYAGVCHIDTETLDDQKAEYILNYCKERKIEISEHDGSGRTKTRREYSTSEERDRCQREAERQYGYDFYRAGSDKKRGREFKAGRENLAA